MMHAIEPRDAAFALALHRFLMRFSSAAISVFLWVIVYMYFVEALDSPVVALTRTLLLYALAQTVTILVAPLALRLIGGNMLRGLVFGALLWTAAIVYAGALVSGAFPHGAAMIGVLLGLYRAFYRAPYEIERRSTMLESRPSSATELLLAAAPLLAGAAVSFAFLYPQLLFVAALLNFVALLPLIFVLRVQETYSWKYREAFAELIAEKNQSLVLRALFLGALGALLFLLWPLALYFFVSPSPLALGAAFSGTLFLILFFRLSRSREIIEQHADGATYVDEYTVLKEMALALGRLGVSLIAALALAMLL